MIVNQETKNGVEVIQLEGNWAFESVEVAKNAIKPAASDTPIFKILINMADVTVVDSSGRGCSSNAKA